MATTIQTIITRARGKCHDRLDSHYVREFLTEQANGVQTVFQLRNLNVVQQAQGSPADLVALVNNAVVGITSVAIDTGLVTLAAAPAALSAVEMRYYFLLNTDAEFLDFVRTATEFVGGIPTFTTVAANANFGDNLVAPAVTYAAAEASRSMASLTHWYYNANAGNKTFNKDQISSKFRQQAEDLIKQAQQQRLDVYERFDMNKAPAIATGKMRGVRYWEPQR